MQRYLRNALYGALAGAVFSIVLLVLTGSVNVLIYLPYYAAIGVCGGLLVRLGCDLYVLLRTLMVQAEEHQ